MTVKRRSQAVSGDDTTVGDGARRDSCTSGDGLLPALDESMVRRLGAVGARLRRYVFVEGMAWVLGFLLAGSLIQFILDYGTRGLRRSMRAAILGLILAGAVWLVARHIIRPLRKRVGLAEVARLIERRYPQLASVLISAVRFSAGEVGSPEANSPAMMASVIDHAAREAGSVDFDVVLDARRARWSVVALAAIALMTVGFALAFPELSALWLARNVFLQDTSWPKRTHLVVDLKGEELIAARGEDAVIEAYANGVQPRQVEILLETALGGRERATMVMVGSPDSYRYRHMLTNVREDLTFHLEGGDDRTGAYRVRVVDRPHVQRSEMRISPPAYTALGPFTLGDGQRAAKVLPGSDVAISVKANKPLTRATLMSGDRAVAEAVRRGEWHMATVFPVEIGTYRFALMDEVGLENRRAVPFSIRLIRDEPPRVRMRLHGAGDMITPEAVLPIEIECSDTYGLAAVELVYHVLRDGVPDRSIPLPAFRAHTETFKTSVRWAASSAALVPGDRMTLAVRARDFDDVSGPNVSESPELSLRVVTTDELLAELARREQSCRVDFERLVDAQEQVRAGLLTALGRFGRAGKSPDLPAALTPLERDQRNVAGSVNLIRQRFEEILAELRVNGLDPTHEVGRLRDGIVEPLTRLAKRDLVTAADTIRRWSREPTPQTVDVIDPQQAAVLSRMRSVLASMIQSEGYYEVVDMLRDVIRLQRELREETHQTVLDSAGDVFDD